MLDTKQRGCPRGKGPAGGPCLLGAEPDVSHARELSVPGGEPSTERNWEVGQTRIEGREEQDEHLPVGGARRCWLLEARVGNGESVHVLTT